METNMSEQASDAHEEALPEEHGEPEKEVQEDIEAMAELPSPPGPEEAKQQKFMTVDLPYTDEQGVEVMRRVQVPIIRQAKERHYKIFKRKRMVSKAKKGTRESKETGEEVEEEYDACMLVETVTSTVLIRDVKENGDVEEREEDIKEEYFIGKERKYQYVKVEKTDEDGNVQEVEELEVEDESEDEKVHRRKRKRRGFIKKRYNSRHEFIGEVFECEWTDEEEGRVKEEFSHREEEEQVREAGVGEEREEELIFEDLDWAAIDELLLEGEEEYVEEEVEKEEPIIKETSFEREQKKQKISFYKLMKLFLNEIERRKILMRDLKLFCHLTGAQIQSPGKEFDENPQKFVDQEAAEVEALTKHLIKVYEEYKEEEEIYKNEIEEVQESTQKHLEEYKNLLVESIHDSDRILMQRLSKGKDLTKLLEETFKHEELLSKGYVKKAICTLNIEQIKYLLFTEVDQSDIPDEQKEVDPFELDKRIKALKQFQNEGLEDRAKLEIEKKKFVRILEDVTCKRREADYMLRKEEEFLKNKPIIEKELDQREEVYLKLKKFWKNWETAFQKSLKDNYQQRFPAIFHNQKKMDVKGLSFGEMLNSLKQHCPKIVKKKKVSTPYSLNSISSNS